MLRSLNDDLVRADAMHLVVQAFALAVQRAFDPQGGKLVRHHTQRPAGSIGAAAVAAIGEDFRRGLGFIAGAERAEARPSDLHLFADEIRWPLRPVRGDDDPSTGDGIFS